MRGASEVKKARGDVWLLGAMLALIGFGILVLYSSSNTLSDKLYGNSTVFLKAHLMHLAVGGVGFFWGMWICPKALEKWSPLALLVCILALVLVFVPGVGHTAGGATRWIRLGAFGFQPVEVLKPVFIAYLARYLAQKEEKMGGFLQGILPLFLVYLLLATLLFFQPDFGGLVVLALVLLAMIFVGGGKLLHLAVSFFAILLAGGWLLLLERYRLERLLAFMDPWADSQNSGFQIIQSYIALGSGGLAGLGLGKSRQKLFFLPEAHTDFIFSILGEELGFLGVLSLLLLFSFFLWRCFKVCQQTEESFSLLLAFGFSCLIALEVVINLGVVLGLLPTKGLPLPFMSYGGSAMLVNMTLVGMLFRLGKSPPAVGFSEMYYGKVKK